MKKSILIIIASMAYLHADSSNFKEMTVQDIQNIGTASNVGTLSTEGIIIPNRGKVAEGSYITSIICWGDGSITMAPNYEENGDLLFDFKLLAPTKLQCNFIQTKYEGKHRRTDSGFKSFMLDLTEKK